MSLDPIRTASCRSWWRHWFPRRERRAVAERIKGYFRPPRLAAPQRAFPEITEREEEVPSLVAQGKSNQEIALKLFVSLNAVRNHVSNILLKLQVADRTQAVIRAREAGMGKDGAQQQE